MLLKVINFSLYHGKYIVYRCVTSSVEFTANTTQLPIFPGLSSKVKDCSGFRGVHRLTLAKDFHHFCFYLIKKLSRSFLVRYLTDKPLCAIILILLHHLHIPVISHELVSHLPFVSLQLCQVYLRSSSTFVFWYSVDSKDPAGDNVSSYCTWCMILVACRDICVTNDLCSNKFTCSSVF